MCPHCFSAGFPYFPSYWEFEAFETELRQKLVRRQLLPQPNAPTTKLTMTGPEQLYQCPSCGETWALSSPDNAWRGYFLPWSELRAHHDGVKLNHRIKLISVALLLLMVLAIFFWNN